MELKSPKAKKKPRPMCWRRMLRTPLLLLVLLGTSSCDHGDVIDIDANDVTVRSESLSGSLKHIDFRSDSISNASLSRFDDFREKSRRHIFNPHDVTTVGRFPDFRERRMRHDAFRRNRTSLSSTGLPRHGSNHNGSWDVLSDVKYLRRHLNKERINFVVTDELVDGEAETRVHFNGITAKETSVGGDGGGIRLRQLTDGSHLVQVIYNPNGLIQDCEYVTDVKTTRSFLKTLKKELKLALEEHTYKILGKDIDEDAANERFYRHFGNMTLRLLKAGDSLPPLIAEWLDYDRLKMECLERHEELTYMMANRNKVGEQTLARSRRSFRENFIVPGTKWCGAGQLAETYGELGDSRAEDRCCRAHDSCPANIPALGRRFALFNFRPFTISHCRCDRRQKRDAMELLRVPGTKWCGKGFSATHYSQLGGYTRTDRCCRVHDLRCPFWIGGMEKKYGLYNWRVNTLMHCRCDERFRACLKLADTSVSNMVGKLFFNVVQTKCFILKPVKMCTQRSWWGKCLRREYMKQAFLRDNLPY